MKIGDVVWKKGVSRRRGGEVSAWVINLLPGCGFECAEAAVSSSEDGESAGTKTQAAM